MDYNCFSNEVGSLAININGGSQIYYFNPFVTALQDSRAMGRTGSTANAQGGGEATAIYYSLASVRGSGAEASAEEYSHAEASNTNALAIAENDSSAWARSIGSVAIATDGSCAYEDRSDQSDRTSVAEGDQCVTNGTVVWDEEAGVGSLSACRCLKRPLDCPAVGACPEPQ